MTGQRTGRDRRPHSPVAAPEIPDPGARFPNLCRFFVNKGGLPGRGQKGSAMRGLFRLAAIGTICVAAVTALTSSVGATDAPGTYIVSATGSVLTLTALGALDISGAASSASSGSGKATTATGSGVSSPLGSSTATASESTAGASNTPAQSCGPLPAFSVPGLAALSSACGSASASEDANGDPTATSTGTLPELDLGQSVASALPVSTVTNALLPPLQGLLGSVPLPSSASTATTLGALIGDINTVLASPLADLVDVSLGSSTSSVATSTNAAGDTVETSTATTQGIVIKILPTATSALATITVGTNSATTAVDRKTGAVTASDSPSDVSVAVAGQTLLNVGSGTGPQTILAGTPLASTIEVGGGSATPGQGSGSAQAGDLELDLLTGISGGVDLNLVTSQASADGAPAVATTATPPTPAPTAAPAAAPAVVPNVTSVHTGEYWAGSLPLFLVSAMGLAGVILITRRRIAAAVRSLHPLARHSTVRSAGGPPPGPASGTSSVPPPVSGPARRQPR